jgi:hypothetical protein
MEVQELKDKAYVDFFAADNASTFNAVQTQVYPALPERDENCFVAAPAGSGSRVLAELAIFRMLTETEREGRYVCVCVCVCIYIYIYVCVCVYIYIYIYVCVFVCIYIYICGCVFVSVCVYTWVHVFICKLTPLNSPLSTDWGAHV